MDKDPFRQIPKAKSPTPRQEMIRAGVVVEPEKLAAIAQIFRLTPKETAVLGLILTGKSEDEIPKLSNIGAGTLKHHWNNIRTKLRVSRREELYAKVMKPIEELRLDIEPRAEKITNAELDILRLASLGFGNKEIAAELNLAPQAVSNALVIVKNKLRVESDDPREVRRKVIEKAVELKLIPPITPIANEKENTESEE